MSKQKRSIGHIKKLDDNKYLLRLSLGYDDFGKRIQPSKVVECKSDREAEKALLEFYNEREKLSVVQTEDIPDTLKMLYQDWTENHVKINLTPKTVEFYTYLWNLHLERYSSLKIKAATPKNINSILENIDGSRAKNAAYKMLKAMFNKAIKWGYLDFNPCDRIDTPKYKAKEKKILTEENMQTIMAALPDEELKFQVIFYFAAMCSMRRQEIIGLKWSDIDFNKNTLTIQRAATILKGIGTTYKETKTERSTRILPLPDIIKPLLLQLKTEQNKQRYKLGDLWVDEDWIFTQWNGAIMCLQTPSHWWRDFAKVNGVDNVTFHGLRHTAASYMIKNNIPITTVSAILGHAQTSTTVNIYAHAIEDTKKSAIDVMEGLFQSSEKIIQRQA